SAAGPTRRPAALANSRKHVMSEPQAPIRVAFLGTDDFTPALLRGVIANPRLELAGICEFDSGQQEQAGEIPAVLGLIRRIAQWETLLDEGQIDAVVVARGGDADLRTEQLRKLVQVEKPTLVSHPVVDSMLVYYELDMIRRENDAPLLP